MPIGLTEVQIKELPESDQLFYWLVGRFSEAGIVCPEKLGMLEIRQKIKTLQENAYQRGYEDGREDQTNTSKRGGE